MKLYLIQEFNYDDLSRPLVFLDLPTCIMALKRMTDGMDYTDGYEPHDLDAWDGNTDLTFWTDEGETPLEAFSIDTDLQMPILSMKMKKRHDL